MSSALGGAGTASVPDALAVLGGRLGLSAPERSGAWAARLELNRAEIRGFQALPEPDAAAWQPPAVAVRPADGTRALGASRRLDAHAACDAAHWLADLNLFTHLPAAPLPASGDGPLAGVPVVVEDRIAVAGAPLSGGGHPALATQPARDAAAVARLRARGAAVVGLANLHELGYGITSVNPHHGAVRNPRAPACTPGGAGGGAAAAVAAGIVDAALAIDTAGSIRIPAACCGVVGFKPGYDVVPREGVLALAPTLDHVGVLGRTVQDCAAVFAALTDEPVLPAWAVGTLHGLRVGRLGGLFAAPLAAPVRAAVDGAAAALRAEGATLEAAELACDDWAAPLQFQILGAEATEVHARRLREHAERLGEDVRVRLETGLFLPGAWYLRAQRLRTAFAAQVAALQPDVIVVASYGQFLKKNLLAVLKLAENICRSSEVLVGEPEDYEFQKIKKDLLIYLGLSDYDYDDLKAEIRELG